MDERVHLLDFFFLDELQRIEVFDLARDANRKGGNVKAGDRADPAATRAAIPGARDGARTAPRSFGDTPPSPSPSSARCDDGGGDDIREPTLKDLHLTKRELDIMGVLWDRGEATVTEVRDRVDPDLAYTSISSMIRTLEMKGYVSHRRGEGKTHVYFPVIEPEKAGASA